MLITTLILTMTVATAAIQLSCLKTADGHEAHQTVGSQPSCLAWEQMREELSQEQKEALLREGAVSAYNFVLSESLVSDCRLRAEMSAYFGRRLAGRDNDADRAFAARYSKEIVKVLRLLWPSLSDSKALIGDGAFHTEKYSLLTEPALEESDLAPLISDLVEKEGINIDLAHIIFSRPMGGVMAALSRQLGREKENGDVEQQIYGLALLQKIGDSTAAGRLRKLSKEKDISQVERGYILAILGKIERGEGLEFTDVERLEPENDRLDSAWSGGEAEAK
jgi:hypothetical protein